MAEPPDRPTPIRPDLEPRAALDLGARPRGKERLEAILAQRDPGRIVAEMPVMDLFYLVKEVGLADAQELVELATPEQFQSFLDLDLWKNDVLEPADVRPWLGALVEAGPEKLAQVWRELDPELTALLLKRWTRIYNLYEEEVPDDEEPPFYPTPDRFFMVKITAEDAEIVRLVERSLDWLYRVDQELARHTLRAAMSEPGPELEEQCFRWRSGRMADLGYAPVDEALVVYQPLELGKVKIDEERADLPAPGERLPAPVAGAAVKGGFLGRVLARVTDPELAARLETGLVLLFNRVLAADHVSPGDTVGVTAGTARAAATLSLGLEALSRGDEALAERALAHVSLTRLHRVGHTIGLQLGRLVAALGARAGRAEEPLAGIAAALRGPRPTLARSLDDTPGPGTRPIGSMDDVRRVTQAATRLAAQVVLVYEVVGADPAQLGEAVTLGDVGRTAAARAALGGPAEARPLGLADVTALGQALAGGALPDDARERVARAFGERAAQRKIVLPPECGAVLDGWMAELAFGVQKRGSGVVLDRKFVEGLLLE
jgi:hypothetical protein